jgi:glycosyltransferase involved in cell wall biosynthesis
MRILQVNSALKLGGGETHVLELVDALRSRGHEVVVAGRAGGAVRPQVHFRFRNSADIFSAIGLRRFLKANSFAVVHAHVARDYPIVAAATLGLPVKVVLTRHLLYPIRWNPLYRRVDGWIAPTSQMMQLLSPLHPRRSAVIPNWVDPDRFAHLPHAVHSPVNLGILGQIAPHKGHEDAICALRQLGTGYRLVIAGQGKTEYVDHLRKMSADLPIEFAGFAEFREFFAKVDILLVPSWEEPFGIVLLEAMASGVPLISTAAGGPLDIIRSGIDGILVPPRNPEELARAIQSLKDEQHRQNIIRNARERVEANFDIRNVVPRVETFYRQVIEAN